jgi:DNA-binding IclR family transcriptional regulator
MATDDLRYKTLKDFGRILSLFEAAEGGDRSVSDISKTLQMLPSKVSRMLKTLEAERFFMRDHETGRYRVGARFLQAGLLYVMTHPLRPVILPHLEQVASDLKLFTGWAIFENDRVIVVDRMRFEGDPGMHILGSDAPLHSTAYGLLFLAYMTDEERERILKSLTFARFTSHTILEVESMRKELARVRKQGYALDDEGTREGARGLAAPIFDARGDLVAQLDVAGKKSAITDDRLPELITYLTEKALFISRQFGYNRHPQLP